MATLNLVEYDDAPAEVRAVYDDIMATRGVDWINNFWKVIANHPPTLKRTWESIKQVMAPGALDPLTKERIYIAASAKKQGMPDEMLAELLAVVGMANETNSLANGFDVETDEIFKS